MNLIVVAGNYPSAIHPTRGTFVYSLIQEMCRQGAAVTTVSPEKPWTRGRMPVDSYGPELSSVHRPRYISFSNKTLYPGISTGRISLATFTGAVIRAVRDMQRADIVYGHFLYPSGFAALRVAQHFGIPSVVALGESSMERHERMFGVRAIQDELCKFDHIITVSNVLRDYCVRRMGVESSKVTVVPNAVNTQLFHPRERDFARKKLGLPVDAFIVTYVGHFDERKGFARVMAALKRHPDVRAIFIGNGPEFPTGEQVLFAGPVKHHRVPEWLAAGDIFVLPTLAEGDPNAVKEALATGLPVIVSDIPALREQYHEGFAIFVDPNDIGQIAAAIGQLKSNSKLRDQMAVEAAKFGRANSLSKRAEKILRLLGECVAGRK